MESQIEQQVANERYGSSNVPTELWDWQYEKGMLIDTARKAAGVRAMKKGLIDNGFMKGILLDLPSFGDAVANRAGEFQKQEGLQTDEVIGRVTARHLFRVYGDLTETKYTIPDKLVHHVKAWESQNDPVARSSTGDEGIAQINPPSHPDVTIAQMWDPAFAVNFIGSYLRGSYVYVGGDWDGSVAAYNIGGGMAKRWVQAGKPASGGPPFGTDAGGAVIDAWQRATFYVEHVKSSAI